MCARVLRQSPPPVAARPGLPASGAGPPGLASVPMDASVLDEFRLASKAFVDLVGQVPAGGWEMAALGVWSVRDLVGHTSRALLSLEELLAAPEPAAAVLSSPAAYFALAAPSSPGAADLHQAIAERGRAAGAALGDSPSTALAVVRARALMALAGVDRGRLVTTMLGSMRLSDYLPTRTFELVVHTLDLARALETEVDMPPGPLSSAAHLATELAILSGSGAAVLAALAGRLPLPAGLSVL